jgi:hypothetical protein
MASIAQNKFCLQLADPTVSFDRVHGTATADMAAIIASGTRFPQPSSNRQFYDNVTEMKLAGRYSIKFNPASRIVEYFGNGPSPSGFVFELADIESIVMDGAAR